MAKQKFKRLCKKCKKFYLPDGTKVASLGYCEKCRIVPGRCKLILKIGYQCQNAAEMFGYCKEHFLTIPMKDVKKTAEKL
jgi:hypothetical protein